jgi:hypothetical protein
MLAPPPVHEPQPQMSITPGADVMVCTCGSAMCGSAALPPCCRAAAIQAQHLFFGGM